MPDGERPNSITFTLHESMFVLDGHDQAHLPDSAPGPIVAGPEAVVVFGRVSADAPTAFEMRSAVGADRGALIPAYLGLIDTPDLELRVSTAHGHVLGTIPTTAVVSHIEVLLTDLHEPDKILVLIQPHNEVQSTQASSEAGPGLR